MFNTLIGTKFIIFGTFENFDLHPYLLTAGVKYLQVLQSTKFRKDKELL